MLTNNKMFIWMGIYFPDSSDDKESACNVRDPG